MRLIWVQDNSGIKDTIMAQTIGVVDPWSGMIKGVETLRQAASAADERKLNELKMQMTKQQMEENALKLQSAKQAWQDQEARRSLAQQLEGTRDVTTTTPGYGSLAAVQAYEQAASNPTVLAAQGGERADTTGYLDRLNEEAIAATTASGALGREAQTTTTTQPMYSPLEKAQRMSALQQSQGDYKGGLETLEAGVKTAFAVPKQYTEAFNMISNTVENFRLSEVTQGRTPSQEQLRAYAAQQAQMAGYPQEWVRSAATTSYGPGTMVQQTSGGVVTYTRDKDGNWVGKFTKVTPAEQWKDLGTQRIGRQEVLVQQNTTTGEKKYTKMSPDVAIVGGGGDGGAGKSQLAAGYVDATDGSPVTFNSTMNTFTRVRDGQPTTNVAFKPPASVAATVAGEQQITNQLDVVRGLAKKAATGPLAGRTQTALQTMGMSSSDFNEFTAALAGVHNIMLNLRSGKAVTEAEYQRFIKEFPTVNDNPANFEAKAQRAEKNLEDSVKRRGQSLTSIGYAAPGSGGSGKKPLSGY